MKKNIEIDSLNEIRQKFRDLKILKNVRSFFFTIMLFTWKREIRLLITVIRYFYIQ